MDDKKNEMNTEDEVFTAKHLQKTVWVTIAWVLLLAILVTTGTYAWFTRRQSVEYVYETITETVTETITETVVVDVPGASGNNDVNTNTASASTNQDGVNLLIGETESSLRIVAPTDTGVTIASSTDCADILMPVSTVDLTNFYYASGSVGGKATAFAPCDDTHKFFWHGVIYLKAEVSGGEHSGQKMKIYLDDRTTVADEGTAGFINAGRIGLKVSKDGSEVGNMIIRMSENQSSVQNNMSDIPNGYVLSSETATAADPSEKLSDCLLTYTSDDIVTPASGPVFEIDYADFNKVYKVDVYGYLEGCDPDCNEELHYTKGNFSLAFYGMLS